MPKICIMCERPARAGEHTFPAALGGRRTNNGIYCAEHERLLGPIVADLSKQLRFFQSLLKIRHDRKKTSEIFERTTPEGEMVTVFDGEVKRVDPKLSFQNKSIHLDHTFGGPEGLRTVAYIALNLFATYFPTEVRHHGLAKIKAYLCDKTENDFVWWEQDEKAQQFPQNTFAFGHTIALTTCGQSGTVTAFVSLFQCMNFGVLLGNLQETSDRTMIIFINPQAESAPDDLIASLHNEIMVKILKPVPLYKHLEAMIHNGASQSGMQKFMTKIQRWKFDRDMTPYLAALNEARILNSDQRLSSIQNYVEQQTPLVYKLMQFTVRTFEETQDHSDSMTKIIGEILSKMIAMDKEDFKEPTPVAREMIIEVMHKIIERIDLILISRDIYIEDVWKLFCTYEGVEIASQVMMEPISAAFERQRKPI